jgi:ABC-2 type transport system permease protein
MSPRISRASIVATMVRKDLTEYRRDRLWVFLTGLVLVAMITLFWVLPNDVDESITIGFAGVENPSLPGSFDEARDQGVDIVPFSSAADLRSVVSGDAAAYRTGDGGVTVAPDGDGPTGAEKIAVPIGIVFPATFLDDLTAGRQTTVEIYAETAVPGEIQAAVSGLIEEVAYQVAGVPLPVSTPAPDQAYVILGQDRAGDQVTPRESFRPLFVFLVLVMEMFVMASLISQEIQSRTVTAVLVTPARVGDVLTAKGITGALSGFVQGLVLLAAIGAMDRNPGLLVLLMALGAAMVSGAAMIAGSVGKDFMSTLFWGFAFMIPLIVPAFSALFPGTASVWIRVLPSYPLVRGLVDVSTYGAGWGDTLGELTMLAGWGVALFAIGWFVLKRRVEAL